MRIRSFLPAVALVALPLSGLALTACYSDAGASRSYLGGSSALSQGAPSPYADRMETRQAETAEPSTGAGAAPEMSARAEMESVDEEGGPLFWLDGAPESEREPEPSDRDQWANQITDNPFIPVDEAPLSTFSIDVDTASYAAVRQSISYGALPSPQAVRIEELINYFDYEYPEAHGDAPFGVGIEVARAPWQPEHRLVRIGMKAADIDIGDVPTNLVFLIDVSGSMSQANKLPLLRESFKLLVHELDEKDSVAMVVYAGASGVVLPPTSGDRRETILSALDRLSSGGSTNGSAGLDLAYRLAEQGFVKGGVNRVILATDGDFNVGTTSIDGMTGLIERKAKSGVFLSILGFGMRGYGDTMLETISNKGNGNYAYIDTLREAEKVLVRQMRGTLVTAAKDVKIQIEFNPLQVGAYRLIGYENRLLADEDFDDDKKDAGEIGAGHTVTALYEVVPRSAMGGTAAAHRIGPSKPTRYAVDGTLLAAADSLDLCTVKLRYKLPDGDSSTLLSTPAVDDDREWTAASPDFAFAASVASFGMLLRGSPYAGHTTFDDVLRLGRAGAKRDPHGDRAEYLGIVEAARALAPHLGASAVSQRSSNPWQTAPASRRR